MSKQKPLVTVGIRLNPEPAKLFNKVGSAYFWRPSIETVAAYKNLLDEGKITLDQYQTWVGEALMDIAKAFVKEPA